MCITYPSLIADLDIALQTANDKVIELTGCKCDKKPSSIDVSKPICHL